MHVLSTENTFCEFTFILLQKLRTNASRRLTFCPTLCSSCTSSSSKEQFDPPTLLTHHVHDVISYLLLKLLAAHGFNSLIFRWCVFRNSLFFLYRVISSKLGFVATLFYLLPHWEKIQNFKFAHNLHVIIPGDNCWAQSSSISFISGLYKGRCDLSANFRHFKIDLFFSVFFFFFYTFFYFCLVLHHLTACSPRSSFLEDGNIWKYFSLHTFCP